jgi:hypothetical protein
MEQLTRATSTLPHVNLVFNRKEGVGRSQIGILHAMAVLMAQKTSRIDIHEVRGCSDGVKEDTGPRH